MSREIDTEEESLKHDDKNCIGKSLLEYTDAGGKHWHCPKCGAWRTVAKAVSSR